jgi:phosphate starvation-inducible protein PhoH and related proteins
VVTGDVTQVDLPSGRPSGLLEVQKVLKGVEGIAFCTFSEVDVVRHPLVQEVVRAYEAFEADKAEKAAEKAAERRAGRGPEAPPAAGGTGSPEG